MTILIDVTRLVTRYKKGLLPTGVDRVCLAYIQHYQHHAQAVLSEGRFCAVLSVKDSQTLFQSLLNPTSATHKTLRRIVLKARAIDWLRAWRPQKNTVLINVSHTGLEHPHYAMPLRLLGVRPVFMVHDLIPITHPEYARKGDAEQHADRIRNALHLGAGIITNSTHTLNALTHFAQQHFYTLPPVAVAPLAHGMQARQSGEDSPYKQPYFVMLGTIEPRKNHWLLLQIWQRLVDKLGDQAPRLVIVGRRGWECENVVDLLERCQKIKGYVIELPDCSDVQLSTLLRHANALLFPTLTEGFGLPIAEALELGVPVIASDLSVFKEFAADVPEYIDPLDAMAWKKMILAYTNLEHSNRLAQLQRMQSLHLPTWQAHFAKVDAFIESLQSA